MPELTITIEGDEDIRRKAQSPGLIAIPIQIFLTKASAVVERRAKEHAPVDTGRLRASITSKVMPLRAEIEPMVDYAAHVEFGTRPHWPPISAVAGWANRHGIPAFLVAQSIARRGTRAQPFMTPAAEESEGDIRGFAQDIAADVVMAWKVA